MPIYYVAANKAYTVRVFAEHYPSRDEICLPALRIRSLTPQLVLVIDDEEDIRELASFALEFGGSYSALTARTGDEGLAVARLNPLRAVMLDWMMPGMDGPATAAAFKADPALRDIPIVFLTGSAHRLTPSDISSRGAIGAIGKPFNPLTLAEELTRMLLTASTSDDSNR